jgi:hypothetical protein
MGTWGEVLREIQEAPAPGKPGDQSQFDLIRRKYLAELAEHVGHPVMIYATAWLQDQKARSDVSLHTGDKEGFLEVTRRLPDGPLDVILHSPGGTAEATEAIVDMLRGRFAPIRFIVPIAAKSAATMLALSGDEIVGDRTTELGPIDPQFRLTRADSVVNAPARAILMQFSKANDEIQKDRTKLVSWMPILNQYGPSLLVQCEEQIKLSEELVRGWLTRFMFAGDPEGPAKAQKIASYLATWENFGSHSRPVGLDELEMRDARIVWLHLNPPLQELVWSVWHATSIALSNTGLVKIFENSIGDSLQTVVQTALVSAVPPTATPTPRVMESRSQRQARRGKR